MASIVAHDPVRFAGALLDPGRGLEVLHIDGAIFTGVHRPEQNAERLGWMIPQPLLEPPDDAVVQPDIVRFAYAWRTLNSVNVAFGSVTVFDIKSGRDKIGGRPAKLDILTVNPAPFPKEKSVCP